jgi:hypothetical protein
MRLRELLGGFRLSSDDEALDSRGVFLDGSIGDLMGVSAACIYILLCNI